jgi:hypothetical protein
VNIHSPVPSKLLTAAAVLHAIVVWLALPRLIFFQHLQITTMKIVVWCVPLLFLTYVSYAIYRVRRWAWLLVLVLYCSGTVIWIISGYKTPAGSEFLIYAAQQALLFICLLILLLPPVRKAFTSNNSFKPNPLRSFKTPSGSSGGSA